MRAFPIALAFFCILPIYPSRVQAQGGITPMEITPGKINPPTLKLTRPSTAEVPEGLPWMPDYAAALKKAREDKKPVLVDFTTDWCGWSKKMDREIIASPDVQEMLQRFVLVRLNPEVSKENEKVSEDFGVTGFPHFVIANYKGEDIGHLEGYSEKKDFVEFVKKYEGPFKQSPLGCRSVELPASDKLLKAIKRIPPPDSRPTALGSFIVLDQSDVQLETNGRARLVTRTATFVADREKQDLPQAVEYYNSSREKVKFQSVRLLDLNGRGREVEVSDAKDEHAYDNQNVYWDARRLSLELPVVKEGWILDVVEEREIEPVIPGQFYFPWNTGLKMLLMSEINLTFPAALKLRKEMVRCDGEVKEARNAGGTVTWTLDTSNPEPYEAAPFSPPLHEIREGCDFFTPCTRGQISSWYAGLCEGRDGLPEYARQKVGEIKQANPTQTAQLHAIMKWVTGDIRYVSVAFGASAYQPHAAKDTLLNAYGDCKDQSMLVLALCRAAAIPAALVLVNAYGADIDQTNPVLGMFNHCIVEAKADGTQYYLDPAAGTQTLGRLPTAYAGTSGLKIDGTNGVMVSLPPFLSLTNQTFGETAVKLNPNGSATVTETFRYNGEAAQRARDEVKGTTTGKMRSSLQESYKKTGRNLLNFSMGDADAKEGPFEMKISHTEPRFATKGAGGLTFKLGGGENGANFTAMLNLPRKQAFRFYATDDSTRKWIVEFPAGTLLKGQPDNVQIDTTFLNATRRTEFAANRLTVTESTRYLEARLPATEAGKVSGAFQKLQDHRDYTYAVQLPVPKTATAN
jgi:thiol-disulfide isomerase/thioredoxin